MESEKKKKIDYEALQSSFMRIPQMDIATARNLIDLGYKESFQLIGISPEVLFEEIKKKNINISKEILHKLRVAVYFVENPNCDPKKLNSLICDPSL